MALSKRSGLIKIQVITRILVRLQKQGIRKIEKHLYLYFDNGSGRLI